MPDDEKRHAEETVLHGNGESVYTDTDGNLVEVETTRTGDGTRRVNSVRAGRGGTAVGFNFGTVTSRNRGRR